MPAAIQRRDNYGVINIRCMALMIHGSNCTACGMIESQKKGVRVLRSTVEGKAQFQGFAPFGNVESNETHLILCGAT